jgi:hypothetical protein
MRTIEEIQLEIDKVQVTFPSLSTLDTTSDVGFFTQMRKMWALLVQLVEGAMDSFRAEIELKIAEGKVGSIPWYVSQAKQFQYGDSISIVSGRVQYDVVDSDKQIVVQAAAVEDLATGRIGLRMVKKGVSGLTALGSDELAAAKDYIGKIKYAGVVIDVTSLEADYVKIVATCKVDRQIINLTTGALLSDPTKFPTKDAINAFLAALPDNSVLNNTELTDYVQKIRGVKDFTVNISAIRRPAAITWQEYEREIVSQAGHGVLHNDSIISYIA